MSVVWRAYDVKTQKLVALKIMTMITSDDKRNLKAGERFKREIAISQSLQHPNILPVIDQGNIHYNGHLVPYLATPFMKDGSLADVMEDTPPWEYWSLMQTADAIVQAAESLGYLHTRNPPIVHEDVKPANFLVYPIGEPHRIYHLYLSDFGISRWEKPNKMASDILGTLVFMAPEQTEGRVMPASDQYSLAIMACLMLTGKLPIQGGTNDELLYAHLNEPPLVPSELNPERLHSNAVDDVFLRALDKDPARRFPSIVAFARALEQAIAEYAEAEANATTQLLDSSTLPTSLLTDEEEGGSTIDDERISVTRDDLRNRLLIAISSTDMVDGVVLDEPLPEKPLRRTIVTPLARDAMQPMPLSVRARSTLPSRPKFFMWSHNAEMLASVLYGHAPVYASRNELLKGGIVQGEQRLIAVTNASQATNLCWSPDGRVLAVAVRNEVRFWDIVAQVELPLVIVASGRSIDGMDWSARGQLAVWSDATILLYTLTASSLTVPQPPIPLRLSTNGGRSGGTGGIGILRWSPDGSQLLAGTSNGSLFCWDVRHDSLWQPMHAGQKVNSVAWSPMGAWFAVALRNNEVLLWDVRSRRQVVRWSALPAMPRVLSISQDECITIASSERTLLCGSPTQAAPTMTLPGQLFAAWSPLDVELLAIDELHENTLVLWQE